jgi:hypothetical protein
MKIQVTRDDVDYALAPSTWDLGNEVLYTLCENHPRHNCDDAIVAKLWLIGRSYAAAIERRKNARGSSDDFYERTVVKRIKGSGLDEWLTELPRHMGDPWVDLGCIVTVHKRLTNLFYKMTGLEKRALASKYLHFHRRDLFFIYDSRVKKAIANVAPRLSSIRLITAEQSDSEYLAFCRRAQHLREDIKQRFGKDLTPRQIDKVLLRITDRLRRARTRGPSMP